jgi:hypothetical protein
MKSIFASRKFGNGTTTIHYFIGIFSIVSTSLIRATFIFNFPAVSATTAVAVFAKYW